MYQRYLGWYDGNPPARLWNHRPTEAGRRYVELAGGPDALLAHAQAAFDQGDYRWVAEVVNHLVFADPTNGAGRELQADGIGTARLSVRVSHVAQCVPDRRNGTP